LALHWVCAQTDRSDSHSTTTFIFTKNVILFVLDLENCVLKCKCTVVKWNNSLWLFFNSWSELIAIEVAHFQRNVLVYLKLICSSIDFRLAWLLTSYFRVRDVSLIMAHLEFISNDLPHVCDMHRFPVYKYTPSVCAGDILDEHAPNIPSRYIKAKTLCHISQNYFEISSRRNVIRSSSGELWPQSMEDKVYLRVVLRADYALKRSWKCLRKKCNEYVE
jgi:hypothetical protein